MNLDDKEKKTFISHLRNKVKCVSSSYGIQKITL